MPDGLDPHRDTWVPVPLTVNDYDTETKTYVIEFEAPKQLLLNPQWEAMVHDELLRNADRKGLVVEGQIAITTRDKGQPETVADETVERDKTVQDVLLHPEKEAEVEAEQDALESPYKMSEAERAFRARMRQDMRDTANEALSFTQSQLDGRPIEGTDKKFRVDPEAFMEGFTGAAAPPPRKVDIVVIRAEALIAMDLGHTTADAPAPNKDIDIEREMLYFEVPDDLSELDE